MDAAVLEGQLRSSKARRVFPPKALLDNKPCDMCCSHYTERPQTTKSLDLDCHGCRQGLIDAASACCPSAHLPARSSSSFCRSAHRIPATANKDGGGRSCGCQVSS